MQPEIRMDPRLERRIAEKRAALDRQRPLPSAIVAKLADDLRVRLTTLCATWPSVRRSSTRPRYSSCMR